MNTPTSIRAIQACKTLAEAKAICADMRETVLALEGAYGPDAEVVKLFERDYDNAVDEMAFMFGKTHKAA